MRQAFLPFCLMMAALALASPVCAEDLGNAARRHELAREMHKLRPTRDQVYAAIDQVAQSQPESERESFRTAMRNILNYAAIEKVSVEAMAEIYSETELTAMVEYYSKPEAVSAALKDPLYAEKVYPEIIRMLDQAMMRVRTGR